MTKKRRDEMGEDYSLAGMIAERRRANGGAELTPAQMAETKALHEELSKAIAARDTYYDRLAEAEALEVAKGIIASAQEEMAAESEVSPDSQEYGANNKIVTREEYEAAKASLRGGLDARVAQGWDPRSAGQWVAAIALGFVAAGVLCLVAASEGKLPRGFFQILRWTVFLVCGAAAIGSWRTETLRARKLWDWIGAVVCAGCAVLFNPLAPIHMERTTWSVLDTVLGIGFLVLGVLHLPFAIWYLRYARARTRESE